MDYYETTVEDQASANSYYENIASNGNDPDNYYNDRLEEWGNSSTSLYPQRPALPYSLGVTVIIGMTAGIVSLITISGNTIVILSFFLEQSIRQPTNYFIASLAVSDLLIGAVSMPLYTIYLLTGQYWFLSEFLCNLWLTVDYTACLCSIYTVFSITVDRYCSVKIPAKYRVWRTKKKVLVVIACIWTASVLLFFSSIFLWQTWISDRILEPGKCYVYYLEDALFNCSVQIGYFWITILAMITLYIGIYRVALGLQRKSEEKQRKTAAVVTQIKASTTKTILATPDTGGFGDSLDGPQNQNRGLFWAPSETMKLLDKRFFYRLHKNHGSLGACSIGKPSSEVNAASDQSQTPVVNAASAADNAKTSGDFLSDKTLKEAAAITDDLRRDSSSTRIANHCASAPSSSSPSAAAAAEEEQRQNDSENPANPPESEFAKTTICHNLQSSNDDALRTPKAELLARKSPLPGKRPARAIKQSLSSDLRISRAMEESDSKTKPTKSFSFDGILESFLKNRSKEKVKHQNEDQTGANDSDGHDSSQLADGDLKDDDNAGVVADDDDEDDSKNDSDVIKTTTEVTIMKQISLQLSRASTDVANLKSNIRKFSTPQMGDLIAKRLAFKFSFAKVFKSIKVPETLQELLQGMPFDSQSSSVIEEANDGCRSESLHSQTGELLENDLSEKNLRSPVQQILESSRNDISGNCFSKTNSVNDDCETDNLNSENYRNIITDSADEADHSICREHCRLRSPSSLSAAETEAETSELDRTLRLRNHSIRRPNSPKPVLVCSLSGSNQHTQSPTPTAKVLLEVRAPLEDPSREQENADIPLSLTDQTTPVHSSSPPPATSSSPPPTSTPQPSSPLQQRQHKQLPQSSSQPFPSFVRPPFNRNNSSGIDATSNNNARCLNPQQSCLVQSGTFSSQQKHKRANRARKALRTITIILGAFIVCFLPWHVLTMIMGFCPKNMTCVSPMLYDISYWLCYLNSPINPFCYALANEQFKRTFARILKFDWHRI